MKHWPSHASLPYPLLITIPMYFPYLSLHSNSPSVVRSTIFIHLVDFRGMTFFLSIEQSNTITQSAWMQMDTGCLFHSQKQNASKSGFYETFFYYKQKIHKKCLTHPYIHKQIVPKTEII